MARAKTPTILSLDRYAEILGFGPLHFNQAISALRPESGCSGVWYQHDWQNQDNVSREYLANKIAESELDLAKYLGRFPAPVYVSDEQRMYPRSIPRNSISCGLDVRGMYKQVRTLWGDVIECGARASALIDTATYTTLDSNNDGYDEWAVFTINDVSITNACEVRAYFKEFSQSDVVNTRTDPYSTGADEGWRVRPIHASLSGATLTVHVPRYTLFSPTLWENYDPDTINADGASSYVDALVFYRVYTDITNQATFYWDTTPCESSGECDRPTQPGCAQVTDARRGHVRAKPGSYSDLAFTAETWRHGIEPEYLLLNYKCGLRPEGYNRNSCEELSDFWAETIAMLATARLDRPVCTCTNVEAKIDMWHEDVAKSEGDRSYTVTESELENPFGTRFGEVQAWKRARSWAKGRERATTVSY